MDRSETHRPEIGLRLNTSVGVLLVVIGIGNNNMQKQAHGHEKIYAMVATGAADATCPAGAGSFWLD